MFVRLKKINGREYGYLVENTWTSQGPRQTVTGYIGKIIRPPRVHTTPFTPANGTYRDIITQILHHTLLDHGFSSDGNTYQKDRTSINLRTHTVAENGKPAVLAIDQGFLCDHTISQLLTLTHKEKPEEAMHALAHALVKAGITISTENMVTLFEGLSQSL